MRFFVFMDKEVRYYKLKMRDGWHIRKETTYKPAVKHEDLFTVDTEDQANAALESFTGRKYDQ